jgi:hypothetical protein
MTNKEFTLTAASGKKLTMSITMPVCKNLPIMVDLSLFSTENKASWIFSNKDLLYSFQPFDPVMCIDPQALIAEENRNGGGKCIDWLIRNQYLIDFKKSAPYLLCSHTISDPADIALLQAAAVVEQVSLEELKKRINMAQRDFYTHTKYEHYVYFTKASGSSIAVDVRPFETGVSCFSIPFLKAVTENDADAEFIFKELHDPVTGENIIVFLVALETGPKGYFNFSHIPPNAAPE